MATTLFVVGFEAQQLGRPVRIGAHASVRIPFQQQLQLSLNLTPIVADKMVQALASLRLSAKGRAMVEHAAKPLPEPHKLALSRSSEIQRSMCESLVDGPNAFLKLQSVTAFASRRQHHRLCCRPRRPCYHHHRPRRPCDGAGCRHASAS